MGREQKVAVLAAGLAVLVIIAMWIGLSDDGSSSRTRRPPHDEPAAETDEVHSGDDEELAPEIETASGDDEAYVDDDFEPVAEGERTLVGTITDSRDELLAGAEVTVEGYPRLRDTSDDEGAYRLYLVPNEAPTLVVSALGYAEKRVPLTPGEPDGQQRVDVQLEDGNGVAGMVVDPEGRPVTGAKVSCAGRREPELEAETDPYGRFALPERAAGCDGIARHASHADSPRVELRRGAGNLIALGRWGSITGVVVDGQGRPVRNFVLKLEEFQPAGAEKGRRRYRQPHFNPRGRFTVRGLAAGTYVFSVTPRGGPSVRTGPIQVESGEQVNDVRVVVRSQSR